MVGPAGDVFERPGPSAARVSDAAILETRYFKRGQNAPYRLISSPRRQMVAEGGHVLPTRLTVFNRIRGTSTEVSFDHLRVNPEIDDRLFTVTMLERDRDLPIFND